jgi:hypothetical protein
MKNITQLTKNIIATHSLGTSALYYLALKYYLNTGCMFKLLLAVDIIISQCSISIN